jgi:hypothetical protein
MNSHRRKLPKADLGEIHKQQQGKLALAVKIGLLW